MFPIPGRMPTVVPLIKLNREKQQQLQLMEDLLITQLVGAGKALGGPMFPICQSLGRRPARAPSESCTPSTQLRFGNLELSHFPQVTSK